jgi:hypothetical protein
LAALIADDADGGNGGVAVFGSAIEDAVARAGMTTRYVVGTSRVVAQQPEGIG